MTADELSKCVDNHEKNASQIAAELGISSSGFSKWINGKRSIDERDEKLLRLYFFGEIPFEGLANQSFPEVLSFTAQEADAIRTFAHRVGITPEKWIAEQIRTIIAVRSQELEALADGTNGKK